MWTFKLKSCLQSSICLPSGSSTPKVLTIMPWHVASSFQPYFVRFLWPQSWITNCWPHISTDTHPLILRHSTYKTKTTTCGSSKPLLNSQCPSGSHRFPGSPSYCLTLTSVSHEVMSILCSFLCLHFHPHCCHLYASHKGWLQKLSCLPSSSLLLLQLLMDLTTRYNIQSHQFTHVTILLKQITCDGSLLLH